MKAIPLRLKMLIVFGLLFFLSIFTLLFTFKIMTTCLLLFCLCAFYNVYIMMKQAKLTFDEFTEHSYKIAKQDKRWWVKSSFFLAPSMILVGICTIVISFVVLYVYY